MNLRKALLRTDLSDAGTGGRIGAVTPGDVLREEVMLPPGRSARALARDIDVPPDRIAEIVNGTRAISAQTAVLPGERFATSAEFRMNLQGACDLEKARAGMGRNPPGPSPLDFPAIG